MCSGPGTKTPLPRWRAASNRRPSPVGSGHFVISSWVRQQTQAVPKRAQVSKTAAEIALAAARREFEAYKLQKEQEEAGRALKEKLLLERREERKRQLGVKRWAEQNWLIWAWTTYNAMLLKYKRSSQTAEVHASITAELWKAVHRIVRLDEIPPQPKPLERIDNMYIRMGPDDFSRD